ncbi:MAG: MaoC family dehydratase [Dehalococcoidia bacterium]|nr:MaoC family dehydratase [Dehalococcoidia bacterium]
MSADGVYYDDVDLGDEVGPVERMVSDDQVIEFTQVWGREEGPTRFTSREKAQSEGLPEAIVPGAMNIAIMSQLITAWSPTVRLVKLDVVFRSPVLHNRPLTLRGMITDKDMVDGEPQIECDVTMENEEGTPHVIGKATVSLPMRIEN